MVPRRTVHYRGGTFTEMDLAAVLARRPQLALVDELAHTNVPGSRRAKRWEDVEELLAAGINVLTTVNIQHLESMNDVIERITGVRNANASPTRWCAVPSQIELVDMTPEALRRRMVHGNVYPSERVDAALANYFRPGNLIALRELALLWLAGRVDEALLRYREEHQISTPWETRERVLVGLTGGPEGDTLIRRGARIAARAGGGELLAVHIIRSDGLHGASPAALADQRRLVEQLGGSFHQVMADDPAAAMLEFARAENATQIVLGASRRGRIATFLTGEGVSARVVRHSGPIDVHIVTHQRAAGPPALRLPRLDRGLGARRRLGGLALAALLLPALTLALTGLRDQLTLSSDLLAYLLVVIVVALTGGLYPALATAVVAVLLANYYFTPPVHTLAIAKPSDLFALTVFIVAAALVSWAVETAARQTRRAVRASAEAAALSMLGSAALGGHSLPALLEQLRETFGLDAVSLLDRESASGPGQHWYVLASCGDQPPERPADADITIPVGQTLTLAGRGRPLVATDQRVLAACATQIAASLARHQLTERAADADQQIVADGGHEIMLLAAQRDMQAPLADMQTTLDRLDAQDALSADQRHALAATARTRLAPIATFITDLQNLSQARAGALDIHLKPVELDDVLFAALDVLGPRGHDIVVDTPEDLPDLIADANLLTRAITSLATNALDRSPLAAPPTVAVTVQPDSLTIHIIDHGPGLPAAEERHPAAGAPDAGSPAPTSSLPVRAARDLTEATGGTLHTHLTPGGGLTVSLILPRVAVRAPGAPGTRAPVGPGDAATPPTAR